MKQLSIALFSILLLTVQAKAQDKLITTDNDTIQCQIQYVSQGVLAFIAKGGTAQSKVGLAMLTEYIWNGVSKKITHTTEGDGCQFSDELPPAQLHLDRAAEHLTRAEASFTAGMIILAIGSFTTLAGAILTYENVNPKVGRYLTYAGAGVTGVGALVSITGIIPITRAGLELREVKLGEP